jgi:hypothetical protein
MAERDSAKVGDSYRAEVKGPNPEVWGDEENRPQLTSDESLAIGEIRDEGEETQVKGPGEEWRDYHKENNGE